MLRIVISVIILLYSSICQLTPNPHAVMNPATSANNIGNSAMNYSVCLQPKAKGSCRGMLPRFYYDSEAKKCLSFTYGGCETNGNNFETLAKCNETCGQLARI